MNSSSISVQTLEYCTAEPITINHFVNNLYFVYQQLIECIFGTIVANDNRPSYSLLNLYLLNELARYLAFLGEGTGQRRVGH